MTFKRECERKEGFTIIHYKIRGQEEEALATNVTEKEQPEGWEKEQQNVGPQKSRGGKRISGQRGSQRITEKCSLDLARGGNC